MKNIVLITLIITIITISGSVHSSDSSRESGEELSTAINLLADTTTSATSSTSRVVTQKELKDARKRRRKAMHMLSHSYERLYFKLSPETYEKMKKAADECNSELRMNSQEVNICTERRLLWSPRHHNRHHSVYHTSSSSNKKNSDTQGGKRGKSLDNEVIPGAIYEDEDSTRVSSSTTRLTVTSTQASIAKPTASLALEIEQRIMSWRDVFAEEKSRVKCYIDKVKANEEEYRGLTRDEWREARDDLVVQLGNSAWQCIQDKLDH